MWRECYSFIHSRGGNAFALRIINEPPTLASWSLRDDASNKRNGGSGLIVEYRDRTGRVVGREDKVMYGVVSGFLHTSSL